MTSISELSLRSTQLSDFKTYYQLVSSRQVARGARFAPARSVSRSKRLFKDDLSGSKCLSIILNRKMIGMLSLYPTIGKDSAPDYGVLELADMMLPKYQNHHYTTRAVGMLINRLRKDSSVSRVVALVDEKNVASRKVLKNNHFVNYRSVLDFTSNHMNLIYQLNVK